MKMGKGLTVALAGLLFVTSGCTYFQKLNKPAADQRPRFGTEAPNKVIYSFPDVPVPKELSLVRERSFIYETPSTKVGVLFLSGNVDVGSLENYFRVSMPKNGWRFVNSFKYGDTMLNFVKEERSTNLRIRRDAFTTEVEIWVGPIDRGAQLLGQRGDDLR